MTELGQSDLKPAKKRGTSQLCVVTYKSAENLVLGVELSYIGQDCQRIPPTLVRAYGSETKRLDLSFNDIRNLDGLERFSILEDLVLDNNSITNDVCFHYNPYLHTLSLNKNKIEELEPVLNQLAKCFPNLTYLSLLGNPACPDQLSCLDKDEEDYQRYRYHVLFKLPKLKFLDSRLVKNSEKMEAQRVGAFVKVVRPVMDSDEDEIDDDAIDAARYNPLPTTSIEGSHKGAFGVLKYKYSGKHSEGNRFIKNNEL